MPSPRPSSAKRTATRRKPTSARNTAQSVPNTAKAAPKKKTARTTAKRRKATPKAVAAQRRREAALPSWKDLDKPTNERVQGRPQDHGFLATVSTTRFAVLILAFAAACTLYIGHVYATQDLLAELEALRHDNIRLILERNRLKGSFDQATGPALIQERARALGFVERQGYGATITLD